MENIEEHITNSMKDFVFNRFTELPEEIQANYMIISTEYLSDLSDDGIYRPTNAQALITLVGMVIGLHMTPGRVNITRATAGADPTIKMLARELYRNFEPLRRELKRAEKKRIADEKKRIKEQKKQRKAIKKKMAKQEKDARKKGKQMAKLAIEKEQNRTTNTFCKNSIEFITQEDIEDIPTADLSFIKLDKAIYCLDKDSFKNMVKYASGQKVKGACKPAVEGQPLDCENFYPINIGQNVYINEKNYNTVLKKNTEVRQFSLTNKRIVDFTTGLHMMSEKSGKDIVYDLVPDVYDIEEIKKKIVKKVDKKIEKVAKKVLGKMRLNVKQLKAECKKKGIKGYSGMKKAQLETHCLNKEQLEKQKKVQKKPKKKVQKKPKSMTVKQLKAECRRKGIKGYSKMKKAQLQNHCLSQNGGRKKVAKKQKGFFSSLFDL